MTALLIVLVVTVICLIGYLAWRSSQPPPMQKAPDPEKVMQATIERHRIRRRLDVAHVKRRQRRDAAKLKREIAEALKDGDE